MHLVHFASLQLNIDAHHNPAILLLHVRNFHNDDDDDDFDDDEMMMITMINVNIDLFTNRIAS